MTFFDPQTIQIYDDNAQPYSGRSVDTGNWNALQRFIAKMPPKGRVLDLGCGAGWAAEEMQRRGLDVHALDASPQLAAIASQKLSRPAAVSRFHEMSEVDKYDGVFACNVMPHVPRAGLMEVLNKIALSLRDKGILYACFASGAGEIRDSLGRYYALYTVDELLAIFGKQPHLKFSSMRTQTMIDDLGNTQILFGMLAQKQGAWGN